MQTQTLAGLATTLGLEFEGDPKLELRGIKSLETAGPEDLSFLKSPAQRAKMLATRAGAVILHPKQAEQAPCAVILAEQPYLAYAQATHLFVQRPRLPLGQHPSAVVAESARLGEGVAIGPRAVIGEGVEIGARCSIGPGVTIEEGCVLGSDCDLHANVTLYFGVSLGDRVRIYSGAVIGADGFGYVPLGKEWLPVAQLGTVRIGSDVHIGANTCVDRGSAEDTVIEDHVVIDNQVQIAHNCHIGEGSAIAGCTGLGGSVKLGKRCFIGGGVGIADQLELCDGTQVALMSVVSQSVRSPGAIASGTGQMPMRDWRRNVVRFKQLDEMARRLSALERS
ncbi:MAG: UDP-3-O-(3-hydroxymyristoyl)glucosamine N-acyltransferase [Planctomycetota bacterium]|nr:MAG: UDP-3-O-(3-hydroxymyristoyl)glucosamine N-acyltransferase [Planctomycetota bacterium]